MIDKIIEENTEAIAERAAERNELELMVINQEYDKRGI